MPFRGRIRPREEVVLHTLVILRSASPGVPSLSIRSYPSTAPLCSELLKLCSQGFTVARSEPGPVYAWRGASFPDSFQRVARAHPGQLPEALPRLLLVRPPFAFGRPITDLGEPGAGGDAEVAVLVALLRRAPDDPAAYARLCRALLRHEGPRGLGKRLKDVLQDLERVNDIALRRGMAQAGLAGSRRVTALRANERSACGAVIGSPPGGRRVSALRADER